MGVKRVIALTITFFLVCHIAACIWIRISDINSHNDVFWIENFQVTDKTEPQLYVIAYYFIVSTFSTQGYGDFYPNTTYERVYVILLELFGIALFSIVTGAIISMVQEKLQQDSELHNIIDKLDNLKREFKMGIGLYDITKQSIRYSSKLDEIDATDVLNTMPYKLCVELSTHIMKSKLSHFFFFYDKSEEFITYIIPKLRAAKADAGTFIFREGDKAKAIYFLLSGKAAYSLEGEENFPYVAIRPGNIFGSTDFLRTEQDTEGEYFRKYSTLAIQECDMFKLHTIDLKAMKNE